MNTQLQEIIEEMKADFSRAKSNFDKQDASVTSKIKNHERYIALEKYILKLTKILNEGSVAAREDIHFRVDFKNGKIIRTRRD